jgi:hypothetical protein
MPLIAGFRRLRHKPVRREHHYPLPGDRLKLIEEPQPVRLLQVLDDVQCDDAVDGSRRKLRSHRHDVHHPILGMNPPPPAGLDRRSMRIYSDPPRNLPAKYCTGELSPQPTSSSD